jgi:hypothetical protein
LPSGKGTYTWESSGDVYVGEFVAGEPKGKGKLTKKDGSYFEGDFKNGNCTGKAKTPYYKIVKINDSKPKLSGFYEGEVNNSIPHGKGTFKVIEGTSEFEMHYTGDWFEGKRHGKGNCKMYQTYLLMVNGQETHRPITKHIKEIGVMMIIMVMVNGR